MTGWAVFVRCPPDLQNIVGAWLVDRTGAAVEARGDGSLASFAPDQPSVDDLERAIRQRFGDRCTFASQPQEPVDWTTHWRHGLRPRTIGRLTIHPSWDDSPRPEASIPLVIDPEMAFGSGEHGSTRGALTLLDQLLRADTDVIDVGSGSGIATVAAALLGARRAIGIEIDGDAIPVAEQNAVRNGVGDRVTFLHGDAAVLAPLAGPADLVISNILRTVNHDLLPVFRESMQPDGVVICAGMEEAERTLFLPAVREAGFRPCEEVVDEGWWAVAVRAECV